MPRGGIPISKVQADDTEAPRELSPWLQHVSNQLAKQQETAVEKSRIRANMISQVNNIMKNPPRYATVDDAVTDMRERTGLNEYLKQVAKDERNVKTASADPRDDDGLLTRGAAKSLVAQISGKKKILRSANLGTLDIDLPAPMSEKYNSDAAEDIVAFIRNNIENSHGLAATIPQLQHDILHVLGPKYRLQAEDIMNPSMAKFISQFILEAQSKLGPTEKSPSLGDGVGRNESSEEDNQDYWAGMMPST